MRMRKRLYVLLISCATLLSAHAQLSDKGYYRIQNVNTKRWMSLSDNTSRGVDNVSMTADCGALVTKRIWEDVVADPGSIFFIEKLADSSIRPNTIEANVSGQGTSIKELINYTLLITKVGSAYRAWQQEKGQPVTLCDQTAEDYDVSSVITTGDNFAWNITPVDASTNYIGVKPTITVGGKKYAALFAGYPYTLAEGMKAYYINKVDEARGVAVYKELTGVIPAKTPVLVECVSDDVKDNLVTPVINSTATPADNVATGIYFCLGDKWTAHYNSTKFDATTMRVLAVSAAGKLAATTATDNLSTVAIKEKDASGQRKTITAIPANSWYLKVSASAPKELTLMSADEYATGITHVSNSTDKHTYDVYTLQGVQVKKNAASLDNLPQGIYIVNGKKVVIK